MTMRSAYVAMQGDGSNPARRVDLRGDDIVLVLDDATQVSVDTLVAALDQPRVEAWSPVTVTMDEPAPFESLHLWLASQPRPYGVLAVNRERTAGLLDPDNKSAVFARTRRCRRTTRRSSEQRRPTVPTRTPQQPGTKGQAEGQVQPNTPNSRRSDCRPRLLGGR